MEYATGRMVVELDGMPNYPLFSCVWLGPVDCYRNQDAILWESTFINAKAKDLEDRALKKYPSGSSMRRGRCIQASIDRGGSTPFNLLPVQAGSMKRKGSKHGASTPLQLCEYWVNYLTPKGGKVLDPFSGVATVGVAAIKHGFDYIGIEKYPEYHEEAKLVIQDFLDKSETLFDEACDD
jgi:DNA modification methylase